MVIRGHAAGGVIVLDEDVQLPDGTKVIVEVKPERGQFPIHPEVERIAGMLPADMDVDQARIESIIEKHS